MDMFNAPMERALKHFLKGYFEEFVKGLDTNVDCSKLPATLYHLELKQEKIREVLEENESSCAFEFTNGRIGSVKLMPSWSGNLEVVANDVRFNLAFCPLKAMKKAMLPAEDEEDDLQNQVPIDIQMGLAALHPGGAGAARGAGGPMQAPPQVPPCYCTAHDVPGKRQKADPRSVECRSCKMPLQTNYVDFALCPPCSRKEMRCMCCGADVSASSSPPPLWPPPADGHSLAAQPVAVPAAARGPQVPPRYCAAHGTSEKRQKAEPRNSECKGCRQPLSTNYVEFSFCPACSEQEQRCMCCGAPAPAGPGGVPELPSALPPPPLQGRRSASTGAARSSNRQRPSSFLGCGGDEDDAGCGHGRSSHWPRESENRSSVKSGFASQKELSSAEPAATRSRSAWTSFGCTLRPEAAAARQFPSGGLTPEVEWWSPRVVATSATSTAKEMKLFSWATAVL